MDMSGETKIYYGTGSSSLERPSWKYNREGRTLELCQLEMLESCRNVLEDIQRSQMLQCDVAHAIKDMAKTLRRIDKRLMAVEKLRGKKK